MAAGASHGICWPTGCSTCSCCRSRPSWRAPAGGCSTTPATSSGCGSPTARPSRPAPCGCSSSRPRESRGNGSPDQLTGPSGGADRACVARPALPEVHAHLAALGPPRAVVVQRVHEARQLALGLAVPGPVAAGALPVRRTDGRPTGQLAARRDAAPAQLEPQLVAGADLDGELAVDFDLARGHARHAGSPSERRRDRVYDLAGCELVRVEDEVGAGQRPRLLPPAGRDECARCRIETTRGPTRQAHAHGPSPRGRGASPRALRRSAASRPLRESSDAAPGLLLLPLRSSAPGARSETRRAA